MIQFCERIAEDISSWIDGEAHGRASAPGLDRASIEAHLGSCTFCAAERRRLERVRELMDVTPPVEPSRCERSERREGPSPAVWQSIEATLRDEGLIS